QIIEPPPLDNGETNEYRRFVKEVITEGSTGPRATSLALLAGVLHNWWSKKQVNATFWFDQSNNVHSGKNVPHNLSTTTQLVDRVAGWGVPTAIIEEELRRQNSSTIDFALCLGATANEKLAARTKVKADKSRPLDKKDEIVANVIWRFLELRGFLTHTHQQSAFGRAMFNALADARVNDKFQDPIYVFLELVRAGVMHGNLWSGRAYSGGPSFGSEEEKRSMLLVMRVLSILPLNFKPQQWSGPLSRELLVFNSFVRSLSRALRTLIESTALNMFLQHHARRQREDLLDISLSLPFQTDVNTGYGILIKVYLDGLVHLYGGAVVDDQAEGVRQAKDEALDFCDETFNGVKDPQGEVLRGFRFWDAQPLPPSSPSLPRIPSLERHNDDDDDGLDLFIIFILDHIAHIPSRYPPTGQSISVTIEMFHPIQEHPQSASLEAKRQFFLLLQQNDYDRCPCPIATPTFREIRELERIRRELVPSGRGISDQDFGPSQEPGEFTFSFDDGADCDESQPPRLRPPPKRRLRGVPIELCPILPADCPTTGSASPTPGLTPYNSNQSSPLNSPPHGSPALTPVDCPVPPNPHGRFAYRGRNQQPRAGPIMSFLPILPAAAPVTQTTPIPTPPETPTLLKLDLCADDAPPRSTGQAELAQPAPISAASSIT
ncbi:hypothetical protein FRB90_006880, partial [Tulasnella sp. 427]